MLQVKLDAAGELETTGIILPGDIYQNICCKGYDWEVLWIMTFEDDASIWGHCENPNCPENNGEPFDPYHGISNLCLIDDFTERILENEDSN